MISILSLVLAFSLPANPARHPTIMAAGTSSLCSTVSSDTSNTSITCNGISGSSISAGRGDAPTGTGVTSVQFGWLGGFMHKTTITFAALTAAATTDITLGTFASTNNRIVRVLAQNTAAFSGGALTNVTLTCGSSAGGNQYLLSCDIGVVETTVCGDVAAEIGAGLLSATYADFIAGGSSMSCRFTCTGANCNAATAGSVHIWVEGTVYP